MEEEIKTKLNLQTTDDLWKKIRSFQINNDFRTINDAVVRLIEIGLASKKKDH